MRRKATQEWEESVKNKFFTPQFVPKGTNVAKLLFKEQHSARKTAQKWRLL